jgi:hypothetical protein
MGDLRTSEIVSLAYFLLLALLAWSKSVPVRARWGVTALTAFVTVAVLLAGASASSASAALRDWLPVAFLVLGYWAPGALVTDTHVGLERWLRSVDERLFASALGYVLLHLPRLAYALLEASYATVYPLVPLSIGLIVATGAYSEVDRFWTTVLGAEYVCYGLLPVLPTRPPRAFQPQSKASVTPAARLNLWVLDRFSNRWNTFPSGHVAGSLACGLAVTPVLPVAGGILIVVAVLIALASVAGRYHYAADAVAGAGVAVGCFIAVRVLFA